jgi:putative Mn2+ efflux pump MntP
MNWFSLAAVAIGLGMDAFAVSLAVGGTGRCLSPRPVFRLSFHFGLFQFLMPVVGWFLGSTIADYIRDYDHWIALGLLAFVGIRMVRDSFSDEANPAAKGDPTRGWMLVVLSVATSIDALAVGLSMAFLNVDVWTPSVIIGLVAAAMTNRLENRN